MSITNGVFVAWANEPAVEVSIELSREKSAKLKILKSTGVNADRKTVAEATLAPHRLRHLYEMLRERFEVK